jgi:hypothetical protein
MQKGTGSSSREYFETDDVNNFSCVERPTESESATRAAHAMMDETTSNSLPSFSNAEGENARNVISQGWNVALSKDAGLSMSRKKRGRKMVLIEVLQQSTTSPLCQTETALSPKSPSSQLNKSIVSEDSFDHRQETFTALSIPRMKPSTIWRRSFSDSFDPDGNFGLPLQNDITLEVKALYKAKKRALGTTVNHRSLSWCADEAVSEIVSGKSKPLPKWPIQRAHSFDIFSNSASMTDLNMITRATDLSFPHIEEMPRTTRIGSQSFHPVIVSQASQGEMPAIRPSDALCSTNDQSCALRKDFGVEPVDDTPRQLAQAVHGMRIAQIDGYSEIYQAMQFPPSILTHSKIFCKTFQFFRRQGVACKIDIGYRYFVNEKEYVPEQGLLPGIMTFNEPFAFYPHDSDGNVQGQLVARVRGNLLRASTVLSQLKPPEAASYTAVEMPLRRSFVQILSSSDQCLPLLNFDPQAVLDLYDNESMGNLVLHTYHQRLQKELDRLFNDGVLTKVPFHLPSEHPDFQPI